MDKNTDFFNELLEMKREEHARLMKCMYGLAERIDATNEILHAICPALEVISTIYKTDQECREAIRRYMNLATDSDNMEDLIGLLEDDKGN